MAAGLGQNGRDLLRVDLVLGHVDLLGSGGGARVRTHSPVSGRRTVRFSVCPDATRLRTRRFSLSPAHDGGGGADRLHPHPVRVRCGLLTHSCRGPSFARPSSVSWRRARSSAARYSSWLTSGRMPSCL